MPVKLPTREIAKVWGRDDLPMPFTKQRDQRIGEIWYEPHPELPDLLVKYLFTSEKLSVQVHPRASDAKAGEVGKEECWLVLDAQPGAQLAIGFKNELTSEAVRKAALDGSIEQLLSWHDAKAGDVFYLPAGTVHAIGPGLSLVEVQQNSDTTFRLFDYGRPRELHLDRAIAVAETGPYSAFHKSAAGQNGSLLAKGPHFRFDRVQGAPDADLLNTYSGKLLALPISGELLADGGARAVSGECLYAPDISAINFARAGVTLLTRPVLG
ncbi:class I mannose-6-phosphate isomerase [Erythrobacter sp. MTPC3]|uniref:class I mannose-6-phosphate isomerase n=1 Tax=Erythrobacter sp. MTPC3 TaxID=3056564 RepID=UPI0036F24D53